MADDTSWNDVNRAFLQALMARGTLTFTTFQPLYAAILSAHARRTIDPASITEEDFSTAITATSTAVAAFDYEIRSTTHQVTNQQVYAFINASSDGLTQAATGFNADEIAFVKRVLDAMFETYNTKRREVCAVTGTQALQLCKTRDSQGGTSQHQQGNGGLNGTQGPTAGGGTNGQITMSNGEAVLKSLVAQGWFDLSRKGFYSLSPRALMELRGWLIETYNDQDESEEEESGESRFSGEPVKMCQACREIVTVGERCADKACPARMHDFCTDRFFRAQQSTKCPKCGKDWQGHHLVGEKAAQVNTARRITGQATSQARPGRSTQVDGADEEDEQASN